MFGRKQKYFITSPNYRCTGNFINGYRKLEQIYCILSQNHIGEMQPAALHLPKKLMKAQNTTEKGSQKKQSLRLSFLQENEKKWRGPEGLKPSL
jgi:hypothetical protein